MEIKMTISNISNVSSLSPSSSPDPYQQTLIAIQSVLQSMNTILPLGPNKAPDITAISTQMQALTAFLSNIQPTSSPTANNTINTYISQFTSFYSQLTPTNTTTNITNITNICADLNGLYQFCHNTPFVVGGWSIMQGINGILTLFMTNANSHNMSGLLGIAPLLSNLFPNDSNVTTCLNQVRSQFLHPDFSDMVTALNNLGYSCPPYNPS